MTVQRGLRLPIALAAAFGGGLRALMELVPVASPGPTALANLAGALLIGMYWAFARPGGSVQALPEHRIVVMTGFLGGLTTFSLVGAQNTAALIEGRWLEALLYSLLTLVGAAVTAASGFWLGERFSARGHSGAG